MDPKAVTDRMAAFLLEQNQAVLTDAWSEVMINGGVTIEFGDDCRMKIVRPHKEPTAPKPVDEVK